MKTHIAGALLLSLALSLAASIASAQTATTPVPATGGTLPSGANSDKVSWENFIAVIKPVSPSQAVFETWASDPDIYNKKPHWPTTGEAGVKKFRAGQLQKARAPHQMKVGATIDDPKCQTVGNAAAGNFPTTVNPPAKDPTQPCYAEEVRRNRPSYDYIVDNGLYTQLGLAAAYKKATTSKWRVSLPASAVEVKADWLPMETLITWLGQNGVKLTPAEVKQRYYTTVSDNVAYGLVSVHISTKEIPNWVWASFEHEDNPGRCDTMGCHDSFGAKKPTVAPVGKENGQYGQCVKTDEVKKLFKAAGLGAAWDNYCLKASQIAYVDMSGAPLMLGDSFTERVAADVPINRSSCIACHAAAAITSDGKPFMTLLNSFPMGNVTLPPTAVGVDFIWGILATQDEK
jgi:hypothetical protein